MKCEKSQQTDKNPEGKVTASGLRALFNIPPTRASSKQQSQLASHSYLWKTLPKILKVLTNMEKPNSYIT
jgi:hypothetical protein